MFESLFQSFELHSARAESAARLAALRTHLLELGVDGFIVPRSDAHQNEYVPACAERLAWLTGFNGSAGVAIVLADAAAIFVDGRYTLAVRDEVDLSLVTPQSIADVMPEAWLEKTLKRGQKLGYDPWLHTQGQIDRLARAATLAGAQLVALPSNPIDAIWTDRPSEPQGKAFVHKRRLAGEGAAHKLGRVVQALQKCDGLLISDPHNLAWVFNLRGSDVAHTPLLLGYGFVPRVGRARLYAAGAKLSPKLRAHLLEVTDIAEMAQLPVDLAAMGAAKQVIRLDSATAAAHLVGILRDAGGTADLGADPITMMKAGKNATELEGMVRAHERDGVALVRFLAWFSTAVQSGKLTEIEAAQALESFRRESKKLKDISFPTISAAGGNSAIPHYRVNEVSNRVIGRGLFLIDSGGQYEDGTTDITRTIAVGKPTREMRDRFTRVLKGHIAIANVVFPKGTSGAQIDALARVSLWQAGLDFDHGTGHGVGSYLSVHEGPQRISKLGSVSLVQGMVLSNEPGYYKGDAFGIRIENLIVVMPKKIKNAERDMLGFVTISHVPIDTALIDLALLDDVELFWLNAYHRQVRKMLGASLGAEDRAWLTLATRPLLRSGN